MNCLGLDYGERRIGVALASGPLAEPLTTVDTDNAYRSIKQLVTRYNIERIVVGDCPEEFLDNLSGLGLPINRQDETLSTHDATRSLLHTSKTRRRKSEHAAAAAIILQSWLDFNSLTS